MKAFRFARRAVCSIVPKTALNPIVDAGTACATCHDQHVRGTASKRIQVDELLSTAMEAGISDHVWSMEEIAPL